MVSVFPSLLSWSELSPLFIRLVLGAIFIYWAFRVFVGRTSASNDKILAVVEGLAGILLILGLWTQIAALVILIDTLVRLMGKIRTRQFLTDGVNYYLLLLVMALSLLVTGPGFLAFDYRI